MAPRLGVETIFPRHLHRCRQRGAVKLVQLGGEGEALWGMNSSLGLGGEEKMKEMGWIEWWSAKIIRDIRILLSPRDHGTCFMFLETPRLRPFRVRPHEYLTPRVRPFRPHEFAPGVLEKLPPDSTGASPPSP